MRDGSIRFADIDFINLPKLTIMEDYSFEYGEIGTLNVPNVKLLNLSGVKVIKSLNGFSVEEIKSNHATSTKIFSMKVPNLKVIKNSHNNLELPISDINFSKIEYIGDCNFFGSLPSGLNAPKLKHIGNLSFNRSGINGDIFLPSLEYIGRDAFPGDFTGTITIPSSFDDSNYQWPSGATIIKK